MLSVSMVFYLAVAFLLFAVLAMMIWRQYHPYPKALEKIREAVFSEPLVVTLREAKMYGERVYLKNAGCTVLYERSDDSQVETIVCESVEKPSESRARSMARFEARFYRKTGDIMGWKENGKRAFHHIYQREKVIARTILNQIRSTAGYRW